MKEDRNRQEEENVPKHPRKKSASKGDGSRNRKGDNSEKAAGKSEGRK